MSKTVKWDENIQSTWQIKGAKNQTTDVIFMKQYQWKWSEMLS